MNLGDARAELEARGFDYLGSSRSNRFLEGANQELNDRSAWPWLDTTTTGTGSVVIADLRDILYVTADDLPLWPADPRDLVDIDPDYTTTTGTATCYWLDNLTVKVFPVASETTLSVRYIKVPASLSADSDEPLFPARLDDIWINLAACRAYLDRDNFEAAAALRQTIEAALQIAQENLIARTWDHPDQQLVVEQNC